MAWKSKLKKLRRDKSPAINSTPSNGNSLVQRPALTPTPSSLPAVAIDPGIPLIPTNNPIDSAVDTPILGADVVSVISTSSSVVSCATPVLADESTSTTTATIAPIQAGVLSVDLSKPPVRDLWSDALARLDDTEKLVINKSSDKYDAQQPVSQNMDELIKLTKLRQKECDDKAYKFKVGHKDIILKDIVAKTAIWLERFKSIGDFAVSFDPVHTALPWAAVKALLQLAIGEQERRGELLLSIERVTYLIQRCTIYEYLFTPDKIAPEFLSIFQDALVELYAGILRLLVLAGQTYNKSTLRRMSSAFAHPQKIVELQSKLQGLEDRVEKEAQNCERKRSQDADRELLRLLHEPLLRVDETVSSALEIVADDERLRILEWYSNILFGKLHATVAEKRTVDTCVWLPCRKEYLEWFNSSSSMILWLHGGVGTGKTNLISKVIDDIRNTLRGKPNHEGLAFFYCNRNEADRREPLSVLRSFVRQLSTIAGHGQSMQTRLRKFYLDSRIGGSEPTIADCQELILELIDLYPKTTLILDALDECEEQNRRVLLRTFDRILSCANNNLVKIFISSRPDKDIKKRLKIVDNIGIQASDNENDISKYIKAEIANHSEWNTMDEKLQTDVIKTLQDKSQGMFQWAYLQIKQLLEEKQEKYIRQRLDELPKDLKEAYDEIYNGLKVNEKRIADRALKWVIGAKEPLKTEALLLAVSQDENNDEVQPIYDLREELLLEYCHHLLVIDPQRKVWIPSHLSVREYMETRWETPLDAHCLIASVCLILLNEPTDVDFTRSDSHSDSKSDVSITTNEHLSSGGLHASNISSNGGRNDIHAKTSIAGLSHELRIYATLYWMRHVQLCDKIQNKRLSTLLKRFLKSPTESSREYQAWQKMYTYYQKNSRKYLSAEHRRETLNLDDLRPATVALFAMCRFGFDAILQEWWSYGWSSLWSSPWNRALRESDNGASLLQLAARGGNVAICEKLIQWGADVNEENSHKGWGSALGAAVIGGVKEVVQLLLDHKAVVNAHISCRNGGSALEVAVKRNDSALVQQLLNSGADVDLQVQCGNYGSALAAASHSGDKAVFQLLLDKGADVNLQLQYGDYGSALAAATRSGDEAVFQLLLDKGADVNLQLQCGPYGSALTAALSTLDTIKVLSLLDKGAEVNLQLQCGNYGSALAAAVAASWSGGTAMVQLLLDTGADVNSQLQCGKYGSALAAAAWSGNTATVQLLLDKGAEVNLRLQCGNYGSALAAASHSGDKAVVQLLLDKGADVNSQLQCGDYGSALAAAAGVAGPCTSEIVQLLLDKGADVNLQLQCSKYGSALTVAVSGRFEWYPSQDVVQLLLNQGVDPNLPLLYGDYGSALAAAAWSGNTTMIQLLFDKGADVDLQLQCGDYGSALAAALSARIEWHEDHDTIQFLLDQGADTNLPLLCGVYSSALARVLDYQGNRASEDYSRGLTAAMEKAEGTRKELAQLLIDHGATFDA